MFGNIFRKKKKELPTAEVLKRTPETEMSADQAVECFAVDPSTPLLVGVLAVLIKAAEGAWKDTAVRVLRDSVRAYHAGELNALMEVYAMIKENVKNANDIKWRLKKKDK